MNRQHVILPALALVLGVGGTLALAAALPSEDTPAQPPAAVQTLNVPDTDTAPAITTPTDAPSVPAPVNTDAPPAPTPEAVQSLNGDPLPVTPAPTPTTAPIQCAPWMEPGWSGANGQPTSCIWAMPNTGGTLQLKACATEDSWNCFWDATRQGNGRGESFINIRGHVFYEGTR